MVKATSEHANRLTAQNFASRYGKDVDKLSSWQMLCRDVGVAEGGSVKQCKKHLKGVFINIVDFVHAMTTKTPVHCFASAKALRDYIRTNRKTFRLRIAKENPLLKELLIHL